MKGLELMKKNIYEDSRVREDLEKYLNQRMLLQSLIHLEEL